MLLGSCTFSSWSKVVTGWLAGRVLGRSVPYPLQGTLLGESLRVPARRQADKSLVWLLRSHQGQKLFQEEGSAKGRVAEETRVRRRACGEVKGRERLFDFSGGDVSLSVYVSPAHGLLPKASGWGFSAASERAKARCRVRRRPSRMAAGSGSPADWKRCATVIASVTRCRGRLVLAARSSSQALGPLCSRSLIRHLISA
jgi:hypothetical protein